MANKLTGSVTIYATADVVKDEYGFTVKGEKDDIKNVLFSVMQEDTVFASLCAIAVMDYAKSMNLSVEELAEWQTK